MTSKVSYQLGEITEANIKQLKLININTLPVRYNNTFYNTLISKYTNEYMRFAFISGFAIAAICARIEIDKDNNNLKKLYIMTINVLACYRRNGIGSELLKWLLDKARKDNEISEVYLHVQTSNNEAKQFYLSHGFQDEGIVKDYYRRIDPPDSYLLRLNLNTKSS